MCIRRSNSPILIFYKNWVQIKNRLWQNAKVKYESQLNGCFAYEDSDSDEWMVERNDEAYFSSGTQNDTSLLPENNNIDTIDTSRLD